MSVFPWGRVYARHRVGRVEVVEYLPTGAEDVRDRLYHVNLVGETGIAESLSRSFDTLEAAVLYGFAYNRLRNPNVALHRAEAAHMLVSTQ